MTALHRDFDRVIALAARYGRESDMQAARRLNREFAFALGPAREDVAALEELGLEAPEGHAIPVRAYRPATEPEARAVLVWLHGGGWIAGDLEGYDLVARALANAARTVVVTVGYRLAPEHPFPAALRDAEAVLAWIVGEGAAALAVDPGRVAVGGDSAGGNLAAVAVRRAREAGRPVRAQLLVYPALDPRLDTPSYRAFADGPLLTAAGMRSAWAAYLGGHDPRDPDAAPLRAADLAGLPPALVAVAGHDALRDEGRAYAQALEGAGVPVTLADYDDMAHGFLRWGGVVARAAELVGLLAQFTARMLAPDSGCGLAAGDTSGVG